MRADVLSARARNFFSLSRNSSSASFRAEMSDTRYKIALSPFHGMLTADMYTQVKPPSRLRIRNS